MAQNRFCIVLVVSGNPVSQWNVEKFQPANGATRRAEAVAIGLRHCREHSEKEECTWSEKKSRRGRGREAGPDENADFC